MTVCNHGQRSTALLRQVCVISLPRRLAVDIRSNEILRGLIVVLEEERKDDSGAGEGSGDEKDGAGGGDEGLLPWILHGLLDLGGEALDRGVRHITLHGLIQIFERAFRKTQTPSNRADVGWKGHVESIRKCCRVDCHSNGRCEVADTAAESTLDSVSYC